jgi:hypothetical protein
MILASPPASRQGLIVRMLRCWLIMQAAMASWASTLSSKEQGEDPCLPTGFKAGPSNPSGSGDWGACKAGVAGLLPKDRPCLYKLCGLAGSFLPPVEGALCGKMGT